MANPFLMDDELDCVEDLVINPFHMQTDDDGSEVDNPFLLECSNPFLTQNEDEKGKSSSHSTEFDAAMSFFGTTIEVEDDTISVKSLADVEDYALKQQMSTQTQKLINEVSNQLDETTSDLLGRIPVTRTPSPVSIIDDIRSPSQEEDLADLLDTSESMLSTNIPNHDFMSNVNNNDNDFDISTVAESLQNTKVIHIPSKRQPPRPPPVKPLPPKPIMSNSAPSRPPPPKQPTTAKNTNNHDNEDLFDVFGTVKPPKPPPPKTKEEILCLFDKPTQPVLKTDLLSDDVVLEEDGVVEELVNHTDTVFNSVLIRPDETSHNITSEPPAATQNKSNNNSITVDELKIRQRVPTPDIEITTVEDLPPSDDDEEPELINVKMEEKVADISSNNIDQNMENILDDINEEETALSTTGLTEILNEEVSEKDEDKLNTVTSDEKLIAADYTSSNNIDSANPFASSDEQDMKYSAPEYVSNIFAVDDIATTDILSRNIFSTETQIEVNTSEQKTEINRFTEYDNFDAFAAKFESVKKDNVSISEDYQNSRSVTPTVDVWGDNAFGYSNVTVGDTDNGFGNEDDDFYSIKAPIRGESIESLEKDFNVFIRPIINQENVVVPALSPPPLIRTAGVGQHADETELTINPFGDTGFSTSLQTNEKSIEKSDSQDTPQTPLFDDDMSQPLDDFPRLNYSGSGWEMQLRQPNKKKITGQRFWKKIFVHLILQNDLPVVQLFTQVTDKHPFQELPLQPSYSVSEIGAQQYDQFGKIFTMKLQYIFYKERPGVRPGQVTKAERITNKLTKFAQYAIAGDYEGVKEFGSDLKKLGLPVEHAPQSSQLFKIGSMNYEDLKQFSICIEEALFRLPAPRERALVYKMEEVQITVVDEIVVDQDAEGKILKQIARVRLFFLAFLSGMPRIELGVNDMWRQGKEVVGRHDIIPVATEEWIRLESVEFHNVVNQEEYEKTRIIKFQPPDANYIELLRFRVRPPKNRELPLQLKATWVVMGNKVELRADILVPGFTSRKLGQIPCEDVSIRFPIPECWIYLFRVEKHFRYGSVKSAHRRTGKIKGIERILGAIDTLQESLIEVTSGQAKYEHHHRAIVWRCPRLPKEGQGAYTTHQMVCRMALTSYDQIPNELASYAFVEFTMPATQVSHTTVRSVSIQDSDSDEPPEKYVRYLARHEYKVGIETTHGEVINAYLTATKPIHEEVTATKPIASPVPPSDSDSDSN